MGYGDSINRINSSGNICWGAGVALHAGTPSGGEFDINEDYQNGIVAIWNNSTHLYAQRVDSNGVVLWNPDGVPVCTTMNTNDHQKVVGDGLGGCIATWYGVISGVANQIWIQRVYSIDGVAGEPTIESVLPAMHLRCSPNPFTSALNIQYSLEESGEISLEIYNITGQLIKTLVKEKQGSGAYNIRWDGKNGQKQKVSNGVYFVRLRSNCQTQTIKTTIVR